MACTSSHHNELTNGVGRCSVPMWLGGCPAGFCDEPAYGRQEPGQRRYGEWSNAWGKWFDGYCSGLACYNHGGPAKPVDARQDLPTLIAAETAAHFPGGTKP